MADQTPSRGTTNTDSTIILDADTLADVQRGKFKRPEFFGDMSGSASNFGGFKDAVSTAATYFNLAQSIADNLVTERTENDSTFYFTEYEYSEIKKKAQSIANTGNATYDVLLDFLIILCSIDNETDMLKIATVLEIDELNASIIREPMLILEINQIYKIAFMASALNSLIKLFDKYLNASQSTASNINTDSVADLFSNIGSILGGLGGGGARFSLMTSSEDALGHYMSEVLEGVRIPMTVIAKNPMKNAPSYTGQTLFGESATPLSLIDLTEPLNKKIGVFPKPSNGAGMSSFGMQNFASLGGSMNLSTMINKLNFAGDSSSTYVDKKILAIAEEVKASTGLTDDETFELSSADVAIPMQIAMSAANSGTTKTPFSNKSFQEGWQLSCHIGNYMQNNNPDFLNIIKGLS